MFKHFKLMCVHAHGASFLEVFDCSVASSSPVRGLGTLQCGIREKVAAWASMGHEEPISIGMLSSTQKKLEENQ